MTQTNTQTISTSTTWFNTAPSSGACLPLVVESWNYSTAITNGRPHSTSFEFTKVWASVRPSVRLSVCPSVCLSVCPSVRLSVCLSVVLRPSTQRCLDHFTLQIILLLFSNPRVSTGLDWSLLVPHGLYWSLLASPGLYWSLMVSTGLSWSLVSCMSVIRWC